MPHGIRQPDLSPGNAGYHRRFITPGKVLADSGANALDRFNRSFEYDGLGDAYARFILTEVLPQVEQLKTTDGRAIHLSKTGTIVLLAVQAVVLFARLLQHGSAPKHFQEYLARSGLILACVERTAIQYLSGNTNQNLSVFFLQDGSNDLNIYAGDWWKANETMERALTFRDTK